MCLYMLVYALIMSCHLTCSNEIRIALFWLVANIPQTVWVIVKRSIIQLQYWFGIGYMQMQTKMWSLLAFDCFWNNLALFVFFIPDICCRGGNCKNFGFYPKLQQFTAFPNNFWPLASAVFYMTLLHIGAIPGMYFRSGNVKKYWEIPWYNLAVLRSWFYGHKNIRDFPDSLDVDRREHNLGQREK